jgi:hypothetical protein|tara:strand:+ start:90 stop:470 length:381 start_codon:yes stop_codon:yes gene_type:complete
MIQNENMKPTIEWTEFISEVVGYHQRVIELSETPRSLEHEGELIATLYAFGPTRFKLRNPEKNAFEWLLGEMKQAEEFFSVDIYAKDEHDLDSYEPSHNINLREGVYKKSPQELRDEIELIEGGSE